MVDNAGSIPAGGTKFMPDHEEIELSITHESNGTWIAEYHNHTTDERGLAYGKALLTREAALAELFAQLTGKQPPALQQGKIVTRGTTIPPLSKKARQLQRQTLIMGSQN